MNSKSSTVFRFDDDGLDVAAFLDAVRHLVVENAATDSIVTSALVRHIDHLMRIDGVASGDRKLAERRNQIEAALRGVLSHVQIPTGPNTMQFKAIIDKGRER